MVLIVQTYDFETNRNKDWWNNFWMHCMQEVEKRRVIIAGMVDREQERVMAMPVVDRELESYGAKRSCLHGCVEFESEKHFTIFLLRWS